MRLLSVFYGYHCLKLVHMSQPKANRWASAIASMSVNRLAYLPVWQLAIKQAMVRR